MLTISKPSAGPELVEEPAQAKQSTPKPQKILPTDRVTVTRQLEILRGYGAASQQGTKSVNNRDVASLIGITPESLSSCNGFFNSIGLIQKSDSAWTVSSEVLAFFRAYEWNKETAAHKLAPLMTASWFGQALLTKLSFKPLAEEEAVAILADLAVAAPEYKRSLRMLIEFLEATGTLQRDGGQLVNRSLSNPPSLENGKAIDMKTTEPITDNNLPRSPKVATAFSQMAEGAMRFNISFTVDMVEMANWKADRIAAFFNGLAQVLSAKAEVEKSAGS